MSSVITPLAVTYYASASGAGYPQANVLSDVLVKQVMSTGLEWINSDVTCTVAARQMIQRTVGMLPVRDPVTGQLAGIITDRDLVIRVLSEWLNPSTTLVASVMTTGNIAMIYDDVDVMYAERIFIDRSVRRLVVLRRVDNNVVGILSVDDLATKGFTVRAGEVLRATSAPATGAAPAAPSKVAPSSKITTTRELGVGAAVPSKYSVSDVMSPNIEYTLPSDSCRKAALRMQLRGVGFLAVCQPGTAGKLLGVLTDRDLVARVIATELDPDSTPVRDVMSSDVACCFSDDDLAEAQRLMISKKVRRLPVLRRWNNDVLGVLSVDDIALYASRSRAGGILRSAASFAQTSTTPSPLSAGARQQTLQA